MAKVQSIPVVKDFNELGMYVKRGNVPVVESVLKTRKVNINAKNPKDDGTLLHYAVYNDRTEMVKLLLKYGANPNIRASKEGITPVMLAFDKKNLGIIDLLLKAKPHLDIPDNNDHTVLCRMVLKNDVSMARKLIQCGADVNYVIDDGLHETPLIFLVIRKGNMDMLRLFLDNNVNLNVSRIIKDNGVPTDILTYLEWKDKKHMIALVKRYLR